MGSRRTNTPTAPSRRIVKVRPTDPTETDLDEGFMVCGYRDRYLLQPEVAWAVDA